ncbi:hypothetical protein GCM10009001_04710 [Virgibacillus siamensis]|uniref:Glycosyl hydrolase family 98 putative carbohydrate-binding module domain-containing protein n=1 Tax=Virgibacillus siamensis TaxID=480071 RepID=A0ABP3QIL1_9BACI
MAGSEVKAQPRTWSERSYTDLTSVRSQKSIITYPIDSNTEKDATADERFDYVEGMQKGKQYVIASHPTGNPDDASRTHGVVELGVVQEDNSILWIAERSLELTPNPYANTQGREHFFAYSSLTVLENGNIGILFEPQPNNYIAYAEFNLEWILNGKQDGSLYQPKITMEAKGDFKAGVTTKVTAEFRNSFGKLKDVDFELNTPNGWSVEPVDQTAFEKVKPFSRVKASWEVTPPDGVSGQKYLNVSLTADGTTVTSSKKQVIVGGTYLSDMDWEKADNAWGPVEKDMSNGEKGANDGSALTINGQTFDKGLGVHAPSEIVYQLDGKYSKFSSYVGVDDEVAGGASIVFQVWGDGEKLYDSGLMTDSDDAKKLDISVDGIEELKLVVTTSGNGNGQDHGDWGNAVLFKSDKTETSAAAMKQLVQHFKENGAFANSGAVRALRIHLSSVQHYAEKEKANKVIKHMKGFKTLLNHQMNNELISEDAYQSLKADADSVLQKWRK